MSVALIWNWPFSLIECLLHESMQVTKGTKIVLRTDVVYSAGTVPTSFPPHTHILLSNCFILPQTQSTGAGVHTKWRNEKQPQNHSLLSCNSFAYDIVLELSTSNCWFSVSFRYSVRWYQGKKNRVGRCFPAGPSEIQNCFPSLSSSLFASH